MVWGVWVLGLLALVPGARAEDAVCRLPRLVPKLHVQSTTVLTRYSSLPLEDHAIIGGPSPCGSENFVELQIQGGVHFSSRAVVVRDASARILKSFAVEGGEYQVVNDPDRIFVTRTGGESLILDCKGGHLSSLPESKFGGHAGTSVVSFSDRTVFVLPRGVSSSVLFQPGEREKIDRVETFDKDHAVVTTFSLSKKGANSPVEQIVYLLDSAGRVTARFKTDSAVASSDWRDWNVAGITALPGNAGFVVRTNGALRRPGAAWQYGKAQPGVYLYSTDGKLKRFIPTEGLPESSKILPDGKIAVEVHRGFTDRSADRNYMLILDPKTGQGKELAEFEYPVDFGISTNGNTVSIDRKKQELLQMTDRGERLPVTSIARAPEAAHTTRGVRIEGMGEGPGGSTLVLIRESDFLRPPPRTEIERKISGASLSGTRTRAILLPVTGGPVAAEAVFDVGQEARLFPLGGDSTVVHGPDGMVLLDSKLGVRARFKPGAGGKVLGVKSLDEKRLGVTFRQGERTYLGFIDKDTLALVKQVETQGQGPGEAPRFSEKRADGTIHVTSGGAAMIVQTEPPSDSTLKTFVMGPCAQVGSTPARAGSPAAPAGERR